MRKRSERIILLVLCCGIVPLALGPSKKKDKQPKGTLGGYVLNIRGYYTGTTTATVGAGTMSFSSATVTDPAGKSHSFTPGALDMNGNHFTGTSTVSGGPDLSITGRLDGYTPGNGFSGAHVVCSYSDSNTVTGRIAGTLQH